MILAAGFGERLRPLTLNTPKPLLQAAGKPLIQYHVENLVAAGVNEIVINTSWLGEQIQSYLGDGSAFGAEIDWTSEECPLETGGGIRNALPLLGDEPFIVVNGDIWCDYPLQSLAAMVLSGTTEAHLILVDNPAHHPAGDFALSSKGLIQHANAGDQAYTFSGISLMQPRLFSRWEGSAIKFPLRAVLKSAIQEERITGELYRGTWSDIGTVERLNELNHQLAQG